MNTVKKVGIGLLIFGLLFIIINSISLINSNYYFPKLLIAGIIISTCSISLFINTPTDGVSESSFFQDLWEVSTTFNKITYILFIVLSLAITYVTFTLLGLTL